VLKKFVRKESSILDKPINDVIRQLKITNVDDEKYPALVNHLETMMKLRSEETRSKVSPDTMAVVVGNLLGILIIVGYERGHVMVSRGLGFVLRTKHSP
jgi:hypothetical protein